MIHEILSRLFDYADVLHDGGKEYDRQIVQSCITIINDVFREAMLTRTEINHIKIADPDDELAGLVSEIEGIRIYKAFNGELHYELDRITDGNNTPLLFNRPIEVIRQVFKERENAFQAFEREAQSQAYSELLRVVKDYMFEKRSPVVVKERP